jgi:hypothetical protein
MAEMTPKDVQQWYQVITDFPNYYRNFTENYNAMVAQRDYVQSQHPELATEYIRLMEDGQKTYGKMQGLSQQIEAVKSVFARIGSSIPDWLKEAGAFAYKVTPIGMATSAYQTVKGWLGLSGLGVLPVIIWGGIAAGTAVGVLVSVGNWLTETKTFAMRVEEAKRLEAQGLTPDQVTRTLTQRFGEPGSSGASIFGVPVKWIVIGAIGLIAAPTVISLIRSRR